MDSGLVAVSRSEIERAHVMRAIEEHRLTQKQVATQLRLSVRQVERLYARYKRDGPTGFISQRRGQRNHTLPKELREEALSIVRCSSATVSTTSSPGRKTGALTEIRKAQPPGP